jgi:hypothetical protein
MHASGPVQQNTSFPLRNHYILEGERGIDRIFIRLPKDRADLHIGVPKQASDRRWVLIYRLLKGSYARVASHV